MKDHKKEKLLHLYLDGELSERQVSKTEEMLKGDQELAEEFDRLCLLRSVLRERVQAEVEQASFDGLWDKIRVGIHEETQESLVTPGFWERMRVRLSEYFTVYKPVFASAMAAALLLVALATPFFSADEIRVPVAPPFAHEEFPAAQVVSYEVDDGVVVIDAESSQPLVIWHMDEKTLLEESGELGSG